MHPKLVEAGRVKCIQIGAMQRSTEAQQENWWSYGGEGRHTAEHLDLSANVWRILNKD